MTRDGLGENIGESFGLSPLLEWGLLLAGLCATTGIPRDACN